MAGCREHCPELRCSGQTKSEPVVVVLVPCCLSLPHHTSYCVGESIPCHSQGRKHSLIADPLGTGTHLEWHLPTEANGKKTVTHL